MTNKTRWWTYFWPRVVLKTGSRYNRDIRIIEENRRYKLLVNGARESGEYIEGLWLHAFKELDFTAGFRYGEILVLGIAGGTVIRLLHERYPDARITGVDIDGAMIGIGQEYFGLRDIKALSCVRADARTYLTRTAERYDLIVIDLFIGPDVPDFVIDAAFHDSVRKRLRNNGTVFINYLRQPGYENKAPELERILKKRYASVRSTDKNNNRFFLGS